MIIRPARFVREALIAEGICQYKPSLPWRCVTVCMPDGVGTMDDMVAVIEQEDITASRYVSDYSYRLDPHVRIVVRGLGYSRSYDKIYEISQFLDSIENKNITVDGVEYTVYGLKRTTNIQYNGVDSTGRRYVNTIEYDINLH